MEAQLVNVKLPNNFKIVITGHGRVGGGAMEIIEKLNLKEVDSPEFLAQDFNEPVFTQLAVDEYNAKADGSSFSKRDFYNDPSDFVSTFNQYASIADMYIACHYWDSEAPLFLLEKMPKRKIGTFKLSLTLVVTSTVQLPVHCVHLQLQIPFMDTTLSPKVKMTL